MKRFAADLHIHTALSLCAEEDMTPQAIVYAAIVAELDLIAVCDHNSAANAAAVQEAAQHIAGDLFCVIAGMEITTLEEAHVVALFPSAAHAMKASDELAHRIPVIPVDTRYGRQLRMTVDGEVVEEIAHVLSFASELNLQETVALVHRHEGLAVAAHVDRPSYSVISQLGFIPEDVVFDALEISAAGAAQGRENEFSKAGFPVIASSDAHFLSNIGDGRTYFQMNAPNFEELTLALRSKANRGYCLA